MGATMSSDSYDPDAESVEHRLIVNGITLTAKKIRVFSPEYRETIIIHILTIGDRSIRFQEVRRNGTSRKTLLTRMKTSKFKKFKSDWAKLWNPALSDEYNSLSDVEKESTSDDGSYITVTEEIGSTITVNGRKYKVLDFIAAGGSSEVYKTQEFKKEPVAIKKVFLDNPRSAEKFRQEVSLLKRLKSKKWIVDLLDYEEIQRASGNILYEVLELGETDLDCLLRERKNRKRNLTDKEIKDLWTQMLKAVQVIHSVGILHLDLKPSNFILKNGRLKLIDFGLSLALPDPPQMDMLRETTCGTWVYASPEVIADDSSLGYHLVSQKSDVWSLGCIFFEMVHHRLPLHEYAHRHTTVLHRAILFKPIEFPSVGKYNPLLNDILKSCLNRDPAKRPTVQELLNHPYFKK